MLGAVFLKSRGKKKKIMIRDLIKTIHIDKSNLEHIAKTGVINGTLLIEIERVFEDYAQEKRRQTLNLRLENEILTQRLIDAGLENPAIMKRR